MCEQASTSYEHQICGVETESSIQQRLEMTKTEQATTMVDETGTDYVQDPAMKSEIEAAVGFLTDFLVKSPKQEFSQESVDLFRRSLLSVLYRHYNGHWHSANPLKGSGFRCLRMNGNMDPLVKKAAEASRLPLRKVRQAFPAELTVWVDPGDVSVRFGEEGSVGVWYASRRTGEEDQPQLYQPRSVTPPAQKRSVTPPAQKRSTTPPYAQMQFHRGQYQSSPIQYQRHQQSSPVWHPQWSQQQPAVYSPQQNHTSPSSFSGNNGFVMALNHQQQQMQQQRQTPIRYQTTSPSWRASPQPTNESGTMENGEEQRCKMLAERLMRENLNLMASLAPGLVSSRPQAVGVGVN